jgi:hypothetical protein
MGVTRVLPSAPLPYAGRVDSRRPAPREPVSGGTNSFRGTFRRCRVDVVMDQLPCCTS